MSAEKIFESVPNFSEGRRIDAVDAIAAAAETSAHVLDVDSDGDHNRSVITLAGSRTKLVAGIVAAVAEAKQRIDLRQHHGVHPRVGAVDVVPIVPLGGTSLEECREVTREVAERIWKEMRIPVYFYGPAEGRTLADIRAGRAKLDVGGPSLHPTAGAVCVGARPFLVAFNVVLYGVDVVGARAIARAIRESGAGLRGVQALVFPLSGDRVQLSMNLFRLDETRPADVIAELERRGVSLGAQQLVALCPAFAAGAAADGRLLEGRLAAAAARAGAAACLELGGEEMTALAGRLQREAEALAGLPADQDLILSGAERAAALREVLRAGTVLNAELEGMLGVAAEGLRAAITPPTQSIYAARVDALDARLR